MLAFSKEGIGGSCRTHFWKTGFFFKVLLRSGSRYLILKDT